MRYDREQDKRGIEFVKFIKYFVCPKPLKGLKSQFLKPKYFLLNIKRSASKIFQSPFRGLGLKFCFPLFLFLFPLSVFAQYFYDASGGTAGRKDGNYFYDTSGTTIGRIDGNYIYDASGNTLGRVDGNYIYDASGATLGRIDGRYVYDASGATLGRMDDNYIYDASGSTIGRVEKIEKLDAILFYFFFFNKK